MVNIDLHICTWDVSCKQPWRWKFSNWENYFFNAFWWQFEWMGIYFKIL